MKWHTEAAAKYLAAVLEINQAAVPAVSSIDALALATLVNSASFCKVTIVKQQVAGFIIALDHAQPYDSDNYRWFCERYATFTYIDRVAISPAFIGIGIGKGLYQELVAQLDPSLLLLACEVNLKPPNPKSMAFHAQFGFTEVGQQNTEGNTKRVSMLIKQLP